MDTAIFWGVKITIYKRENGGERKREIKTKKKNRDINKDSWINKHAHFFPLFCVNKRGNWSSAKENGNKPMKTWTYLLVIYSRLKKQGYS